MPMLLTEFLGTGIVSSLLFLFFRGIGNPSGWTIEFEKDDKIISATGNHFFHDALAELEFGELENKKQVIIFFFI